MAFEPEYALAYAGLAESYVALSWLGENPLAPGEVFPRARAAALRALQIDPAVADAHVALGLVAWRYARDAIAAEEAFAHAIEIEPSNADALHWFAMFLTTRGRFDEALALIDRALELDPLSLLITANRGWIQYFSGRPSDALSNAGAAQQLWPASGIPYYHQGLVLVQLGRVDEAIQAFENAIERSGRLPYLLAALGHASAVAGDAAGAKTLLLELRERNYAAPYLQAAVELALGNSENALGFLGQALDAQDAYLAFLAVDPIWGPLRSEPRFASILGDAGYTIPGSK